MPNTRPDRWWFVGLVLVVFCYILARAILVPLVNDEATSFLAYAQTGRFLPFHSMWDANNHYLNSLCGSIGYRLHGLTPLALRWASVASFLLYASATWRLGSLVSDRRVRWMLWTAVLMCPLVLDFFSLFRGYGPAMAFLLLACTGTLQYMRSTERRDLVLALIGLGLANASLLALGPTWSIFIVALAIRWWTVMAYMTVRERKTQALLLLLMGVVPLVGAAGLAFVMARFGLLYHGGTEGFVEVTVASIARYVFGLSEGPMQWSIVIATTAAALYGLYRGSRSKELTSPLFLVSALLVVEVLSRMFLARFFGLNYPEDRTALHLVLFAILLLALAADELTQRSRFGYKAALPLLLLPLRTLAGANVDSTVLWPEQCTPYRFLETVNRAEATLGRPPVAGNYHLSGITWSLQQRMLDAEGDANAQGYPMGMHDFRIADERAYPQAWEGYHEIDRGPEKGVRLLVRDEPVRTTIIADTAFTLEIHGTDRSAMLGLPVAALLDRDLLIEISGRVISASNSLDLHLAVVARDTLNEICFGDHVFLSTRRMDWKGEAWRTIRFVPKSDRVGSLQVFFQDTQLSGCSITDGRLVVRTIDP